MNFRENLKNGVDASRKGVFYTTERRNNDSVQPWIAFGRIYLRAQLLPLVYRNWKLYRQDFLFQTVYQLRQKIAMFRRLLNHNVKKRRWFLPRKVCVWYNHWAEQYEKNNPDFHEQYVRLDFWSSGIEERQNVEQNKKREVGTTYISGIFVRCILPFILVCMRRISLFYFRVQYYRELDGQLFIHQYLVAVIDQYKIPLCLIREVLNKYLSVIPEFSGNCRDLETEFALTNMVYQYKLKVPVESVSSFEKFCQTIKYFIQFFSSILSWNNVVYFFQILNIFVGAILLVLFFSLCCGSAVFLITFYLILLFELNIKKNVSKLILGVLLVSRSRGLVKLILFFYFSGASSLHVAVGPLCGIGRGVRKKGEKGRDNAETIIIDELEKRLCINDNNSDIKVKDNNEEGLDSLHYKNLYDRYYNKAKKKNIKKKALQVNVEQTKNRSATSVSQHKDTKVVEPVVSRDDQVQYNQSSVLRLNTVFSSQTEDDLKEYNLDLAKIMVTQPQYEQIFEEKIIEKTISTGVLAELRDSVVILRDCDIRATPNAKIKKYQLQFFLKEHVAFTEFPNLYLLPSYYFISKLKSRFVTLQRSGVQNFHVTLEFYFSGKKGALLLYDILILAVIKTAFNPFLVLMTSKTQESEYIYKSHGKWFKHKFLSYEFDLHCGNLDNLQLLRLSQTALGMIQNKIDSLNLEKEIHLTLNRFEVFGSLNTRFKWNRKNKTQFLPVKISEMLSEQQIYIINNFSLFFRLDLIQKNYDLVMRGYVLIKKYVNNKFI